MLGFAAARLMALEVEAKTRGRVTASGRRST
jgi:hypothetical protein